MKLFDQTPLKVMFFIKEMEERIKRNGIRPFSEATAEPTLINRPVYYDDCDGPDTPGEYKIVCDMCISPEHHDVVDYYDNNFFGTETYPDITVDDDGDVCLEWTMDEVWFCIYADGRFDWGLNA